MEEEKNEWVPAHKIFLKVLTDEDKVSAVEDVAAALRFYGEFRGKCPVEAIPQIIEAIESLKKRGKLVAEDSVKEALGNLRAQLQEAEEKKNKILAANCLGKMP